MLDADTLERAAVENKPIFMHIGFLADHRKCLPLPSLRTTFPQHPRLRS
jgi:hypothetical protein